MTRGARGKDYRPQDNCRPQDPQDSGFTLIELMLVCLVLAAVSYVAWGAYIGVDRRAEDQLARPELLKLATALQRFHQDTGYWPGEGPFQHADGGDCATSPGGIVNASLPPLSGDGADPNTGKDWLRSPANFWLLFERPTLCATHPLAGLARWDATARRGWNGPYLPLAVRHWVDAWPALAESANGTEGVAPAGKPLLDLPSFGVGPALPPEGEDHAGCAGNACFLGWRGLPRSTTGYAPAAHDFARHARPFLFLLEAPVGNPRGTRVPRVIYWGADGRFGGTGHDDADPAATDPCLPNASHPDGKDDLVICLG
jgi:prepilin-type N-terminal cleavage/methylation domain-containing protein